MSYFGRNTAVKLITVFFIFMSCPAFAAGQRYLQLPASIHVSSRISDGRLSLEEIAQTASENGFDVLIPAERDFMRWEYGIRPLRNILKKRVQQRCVFSYGIKEYLRRMDSLKKQFPGMIIINGLESAPYYYWQGSIFGDDLTIRDWHKHMLVLGLSRPSDLEYIPVIGNPRGLRQPLGMRTFFLALLPLALAALAVLCVRRRQYRYADSSGNPLGPYSRPWRITGISLFIIAALVFINNYPFRDTKFDQYHNNIGVMPYQNIIDYVNNRAGLIFWAHPEAANSGKSGPIGFATDEHSDHLLLTRGYTGFAVFHEGFKRVGRAGGVWDQVLLEYCRGSRRSPVWAIACLAYDKTGSLSSYMRDVRTVLLSRARTADDAMDALRKGRMYCVRGKGSSEFILDRFTVTDSYGNDMAMGEEAAVRDDPVIRIEGHILHGQKKSFTIQLIRDGRLMRVFEAESPFALSYVDSSDSGPSRSFYRVQITSGDLTVVSNPVFVQRQ